MMVSLETYTTSVLAPLLVLSSPAAADDDGTAFWMTGQYASMSAVPPSPGWSLITLINGYRGSLAPLRVAPSLNANELSGMAVLQLQPGYRSRMAAIGPQIGYQHSWKTGSPYLNRRGYQEFWGRSRDEGQSAFLEPVYAGPHTDRLALTIRT